MIIDDIKNAISSGHICVTWDYKGKRCGVDPYYSPSDDTLHFPMWYGDKDEDFTSVDDVLSAKFLTERLLRR